jgi:hypothetical protein
MPFTKLAKSYVKKKDLDAFLHKPLSVPKVTQNVISYSHYV